MPLSLALFSDMVGLSAMAIMSHWIIGLVWFPKQSFEICAGENAYLQMTQDGHGRNPTHVREQGQRKWHFWISMVSPMSIISEMVSCPDMNHKVTF